MSHYAGERFVSIISGSVGYNDFPIKCQMCYTISMTESAKNEYDKASIVKDIEERAAIIQRFYATGELDREDAIKKFQALQSKDSEAVAVMAVERIKNGDIDICSADNNTIVGNLQFQVDFLNAKLLK